jgi:hypothetical protein
VKPLLRHGLRLLGLGMLLGVVLYAAYLAWGMLP